MHFLLLPLEERHPKDSLDNTNVFMINQVEVPPVMASCLKQATARNPLLSKVGPFCTISVATMYYHGNETVFRHLELPIEQTCVGNGSDTFF